MGLDVTLGVLVLLAGIRGWMRGFTLQAIRLAALVASVYLADPIRDVAAPYAREQLPTVAPALLDRFLWWIGSIAAFLVISGVATQVVKAVRKRPYGEAEPKRSDQGSGFLLGAIKGFVFVAFLTAAVDRYAVKYLQDVAWAKEQIDVSRAIEWSRQYRPAERIWTAPAVQQFVLHVPPRGLPAVEPAVKERDVEKKAALDDERHARSLEIPPPLTDAQLDAELDAVEKELRRARHEPAANSR